MKKIITLIMAFLFAIIPVFAENNQATANISVYVPSYVQIESVLSPVLVANITDRTGKLYTPLHTRFRVTTNSSKTQTLYLKSNIITDSGLENSMFEQGGRAYIAFGNLAKIPKSSSLANCKIGSDSKDSPGVVAYPVTSIRGAKHKFNRDKFEVYVDNGTTNIDVNVGSNVLTNSFAYNDTNGFYQAILSLTEADI